MFRFNPEESKNRLEFSDQKRTHLQALLEEETAGEDTFVWSLLDLMTILLIFFIFIYTQSAGQLDSISQMHPPLQEQGYVFKIKRPAPQELPSEIPAKSGRIMPPVSVNVPESVNERTSAAGPIPEQASQLSAQHKTEGIAESIEQIRKDALKAMDESDDQAFSLRWNQHRLVFVLDERVTFPIGQAKLLESFQPTLQRIAALIASKEGYMVVISGHTDDTPIKTAQFPSNWELSAARAISVAKSLTENGVDPARVSIQGNAEYRPLYQNATPANKRANRRVEITLIKEKQ